MNGNLIAGTVKKPAALTIGEPAGIGPDITLKAWLKRKEYGLDPFMVLGDLSVLSARAKLLNLKVPLAEITTASEAPEYFDQALPVLSIPCPKVTPGIPSRMTTSSVIEAIEVAVALTLRLETCAVVTNPIAKSVLAREGFAHPGHTEFLAELSRTGNLTPLPVMMLAAPALKVVPITTHIALKDLPSKLSKELILNISRITVLGLKLYFGIDNPRLLFAGLNPHAGEDGMMGFEERDIIRPAVEELKAQGFRAEGPVSADTMFHDSARDTYDIAICMYHDQALIPVKTLAFDSAVNVTLGLPFLRTSPDHGTAFSLAGTGKAYETSLVSALTLATQQSTRSSKVDYGFV